MATQATPVKAAESRAGKYLAFRLGDETYGLEILKVREVITMMDITHVPRTPAFIKGVINLRGRVIAVTDLRTKFGMPAVAATAERCIVVVNVAGLEMGLIVDNVSEVLDVAADAIEDTPSFGAGVSTDFILGIGKTGEKVTILLDVDKVLSQTEIEAVKGTGSNA
jgi:purine-binding chemotaxis protein CheW